MAGSLVPVRTRRGIFDYALKRRALLAQVRSGLVGTDDVCDATPYLLSAAAFHGRAADRDCPLCHTAPLSTVSYVYGEELKTAAGQARSAAELTKMQMDYRSFTVYEIEVCTECRWNHLMTSYLLGRDGLTGESAADHATGR